MQQLKLPFKTLKDGDRVEVLTGHRKGYRYFIEEIYIFDGIKYYAILGDTYKSKDLKLILEW